MAKTDDPIYDLQFNVQRLTEELNRVKTALDNHQETFARFVEATNAYLFEKDPTNADLQYGVVNVLYQKEIRERREYERSIHIERLRHDGYTIIPPEGTSSTGPV